MYYNITSLLAFAAVFVAELLTTEAEFNPKLLSLIKNQNEIEHFESVFLYESSQSQIFINFDDKFVKDVSSSLNIPVILTTESSSFYLKENFNENLLTLVQYDSSDLFLQRLLEHLQHLRFCKTIFVLKNSSRNDLELKSLFNFCLLNRLINVVAVFQDFSSTSAYYSYHNIEDLTIEEFIWKMKVSNIFPNRMQNLHGIILPISLGGVQPGLIITKNSNGDTMIGGYLGNIYKSFAKRHNGRLSISYGNGTVTPGNINQLVLNGTIEIGGSMIMLSQVSFNWYSYPFTVLNWGVMLPVESNIPIYKVFAFVFYWEAFILIILIFILLSISLGIAAKLSGSKCTFFFNIDCFRGILGQSFSEDSKASYSTKIIYLLIFLLGIMIVTSYDAFLQSFMTQPPKEKLIKNFDDLQSSGLKIYLSKWEIDEFLYKLRPNFMKNYSNSFQVEPNLEILKRLRDTLNTKYAFAVTSMSWMNYESQQKFFNQKLFRWSEELCLLKNKLLAIFLNENSIYKKILNFHILETQSSGLFDFWVKRTFYELLRVGRIKKFNSGLKPTLKALKVEDLKWVWKFMGLALIVGILSFIGEMFIFKFKKNGLNVVKKS
ncbi:uncharacterized protein LOC129919621 [Episyrphus balteatus]|uniref:uncharacterized protein LOC129919621 n=1 Tax=Episyrphus balteatus TaxID=286459 RepID=UPI002485B1DE|nr:uncharacterized protein LOC129919621 [Episyrphus balteatus]